MKYLRKFNSLSEYRAYIHNTGFTSLCMYTEGGNAVVANEIIVPHTEIWYISYDGEIVEPTNPEAFGATILTNTYSNGKGVITFDGNVTAIGDGAFAGNGGLVSIKLPYSVTSIGQESFVSCYELTNITIPDSVTSIGYAAFPDCQNLTSVTIPSSVTTIRGSAFYNVPHIYYNGSATGSPWGARAIN